MRKNISAWVGGGVILILVEVTTVWGLSQFLSVPVLIGMVLLSLLLLPLMGTVFWIGRHMPEKAITDTRKTTRHLHRQKLMRRQLAALEQDMKLKDQTIEELRSQIAMIKGDTPRRLTPNHHARTR